MLMLNNDLELTAAGYGFVVGTLLAWFIVVAVF